jgi:hypothetical protein
MLIVIESTNSEKPINYMADIIEYQSLVRQILKKTIIPYKSLLKLIRELSSHDLICAFIPYHMNNIYNEKIINYVQEMHKLYNSMILVIPNRDEYIKLYGMSDINIRGISNFKSILNLLLDVRELNAGRET